MACYVTVCHEAVKDAFVAGAFLGVRQEADIGCCSWLRAHIAPERWDARGYVLVRCFETRISLGYIK